MVKRLVGKVSTFRVYVMLNCGDFRKIICILYASNLLCVNYKWVSLVIVEVN